jgi:hypothetical protein
MIKQNGSKLQRPSDSRRSHVHLVYLFVPTLTSPCSRYWDWSSGQDVPSVLISDPTVTVRQAPRGEAKPDYPNPFLSYTFQQEGDVPAWRNRFKNTVRFANPAGADSKSDPKALVA